MASILQGGKGGMASAPADRRPPAEHNMDTGEIHSHLVTHADGTHHIEHEDGTQTEHEHIGHALMHMAGKHSEGMHHHTHSDGMGGGHTTHTASHGGEPEGPHEHATAEEAGEHLKNFFGGEESGEYDEAGKMAGKNEETSHDKDYD